MTIVLDGTAGITAPSLDALDIELNNVNVVERGNNANGQFTRYADGTQICWHGLAAGGNLNTAQGSIFRTPSATWTFPAAFVSDSGRVFVMESAGVGSSFGGLGSVGASTTSCSYMIFSGVSTASTPQVSLVAIGRWF